MSHICEESSTPAATVIEEPNQAGRPAAFFLPHQSCRVITTESQENFRTVPLLLFNRANTSDISGPRSNFTYLAANLQFDHPAFNTGKSRLVSWSRRTSFPVPISCPHCRAPGKTQKQSRAKNLFVFATNYPSDLLDFRMRLTQNPVGFGP